MFKTILLVLALGLSSQAFSRTYSLKKAPEVIGQEVRQQVSQMKQAFRDMDFSETKVLASHENSKEAWILSRVRFMIQPLVKFKVLIFGLKIAPMLEFRWQRKPPRGWKTYHPLK